MPRSAQRAAKGARCASGSSHCLARAVLFALRENLGGEQFVDAEELELYGVAAAIGRGIDEGERARQILRMIARRLGDEFRALYQPLMAPALNALLNAALAKDALTEGTHDGDRRGNHRHVERP